MNRHGFVTLKEARVICAVSGAILKRLIEEDGIPLHQTPDGVSLRWSDLRKCFLRRRLPMPQELESGPRILLVDDDEDLLVVMLDALEPLWDRPRIATASDGARGLKKLVEFKPDLVVTDIEMPNMSGIELCRWVRQSRDLISTKILAVTGYHNPRRNAAVLESGADEYITKPFTPQDLRQAAVRLLGPDPVMRPAAAGAAQEAS